MYEKVERFETETEAPSTNAANHFLGNNDSHLRVTSLWIPVLVSIFTLIVFLSLRVITTSSRSNSEKLIPGNMSQAGLDFLDRFMPESITQKQLDECFNFASTADERFYNLIQSGDWEIEAVTSQNDTISSMTLPQPIGKVHRITGVLSINAKKLINYLMYELESSPIWNKQVTEAKILHRIDDHTDLVYQATSPIYGGVISPRDFVLVRKIDRYEEYYINSMISFDDLLPERTDFVRAQNGLSGYSAKSLSDNECLFTWILNTDLKGWIPQMVIDLAMPAGMTELLESLRNHLSQI